MTSSAIINLFFSFSGRIDRKLWWLATIFLLALQLGVGFLIDPNYFSLSSKESEQEHLGTLLWDLSLVIPGVALTVKRLNDRDWRITIRIAYLVSIAVMVTFQVMLFMTPISNPAITPDSVFTPEDLLFFSIIPFALFLFWVLFDNALIPGTDGPNRYGMDPRWADRFD